jgi:hypothetical protein
MRLNDKTRVMTLGRLNVEPLKYVSPLASLGAESVDLMTEEVMTEKKQLVRKVIVGSLSVTSGILSGVHGNLRNRRLKAMPRALWTAVWTLSGLVLPVITVAYAAGQGFTKSKKR